MAIPGLLYIKLGLVAACVGGAAYVAWEVRSSSVDAEKREAVETATKQIQKDLDAERALRAHFERLSDGKLADLLKSISGIADSQAAISQSIAEERASNRAFYSQQLPKGGYEQWKKARALVSSSAASSPR